MELDKETNKKVQELKARAYDYVMEIERFTQLIEQRRQVINNINKELNNIQQDSKKESLPKEKNNKAIEATKNEKR